MEIPLHLDGTKGKGADVSMTAPRGQQQHVNRQHSADGAGPAPGRDRLGYAGKPVSRRHRHGTVVRLPPGCSQSSVVFPTGLGMPVPSPLQSAADSLVRPFFPLLTPLSVTPACTTRYVVSTAVTAPSCIGWVWKSKFHFILFFEVLFGKPY